MELNNFELLEIRQIRQNLIIIYLIIIQVFLLRRSTVMRKVTLRALLRVRMVVARALLVARM